MAQTATEPDLQLVDLQVPTVVLDAAKARVEQVREQERRTIGVAETTVATVVRFGLLEWKRPPGKPPARARWATHEQIRKWAAANGHGEITGTPPPQVREAYREAHGLDTHPLRFTMPRAPYAAVKDRIHLAGWSVAGVVQKILEDFARKGPRK